MQRIRAFSASFSASALLVLVGGLASAQYAEGHVHELSRASIGSSRNLFGWAAVGLGDVDGDGTLDFAVASPFATNGVSSSAGRVHALSGATSTPLWFRNETRTSAILPGRVPAADRPPCVGAWWGDHVL